MFDINDFIEVALFSKSNFLILLEKLKLFGESFTNKVMEQFITVDKNINIIDGFKLEINFITNLLSKLSDNVFFDLDKIAKLFINYKNIETLYHCDIGLAIHDLTLVNKIINAKITNNKPIDVINIEKLYDILYDEFIAEQNNLTNDLHFYNDANKDIIKNKFIELEKETTDFGQTARINNLLNHIK